MDQEQIRQFYEKYFYHVIVAGIVIGLALCSIPMALAIRKKRRNLGIFVFIAGGIVGGFSPVFSLILALIFSLIFWKLPAPVSDVDSDATSLNN